MDVTLMDCHEPSEIEWRTLENLAVYQYGIHALPAVQELAQNKPRVCISRTTGKMRRIVLSDGTIALTIRASDYVLIPHAFFAKLLHRHLPFPFYRIIVANEMVEDIMQGWTLFARHVVAVDENIRPGDEVLIVDERDRLLAVGRTILGYLEILTSTYGPAAIIREKVLANAAI